MLYIFIPIIRNKFNKKIPLPGFHAPIFNSANFKSPFANILLASLN